MRDSIVLVLLGLIVAFTVFSWAGVTPREWNITLTAICLLSLYVWLSSPVKAFAPALSPATWIVAAAVLTYIAFQLLPLPTGLLQVISPNRFEIARGIAPLHSQGWAPLSVSPQLTFAQLLRLLAYCLVFCLTREFGFRLADREWVIALPLLVIASIESSIGLVQHYETGGYATGTYANHGHLAGLLEMSLPLTLILIPIRFDRTRRAGRESARTAVIVCALAACAVLILLGLLYTSSRMGLAAAAVSMAILGVLAPGSRRNRNTIAFLAAAAGLTLLLLSAPLSLVIRYEGGLTSEVRLQIWTDTLKLIAQYPIFGCGLGAFVSAVQKYRAATPLALVDFAHDDYLQLVAELGAVGFLLLMGLAGLVVREVVRGVRVERNQSVRLMAAACTASLATMAVHSLVDFQFYIPANVMVAAWIAGFASGIGVRTAPKRFAESE